MYTSAFVYILLKIIHLEIRNSKPAHSFNNLYTRNLPNNKQRLSSNVREK